jgi:hypothetical protein
MSLFFRLTFFRFKAKERVAPAKHCLQAYMKPCINIRRCLFLLKAFFKLFNLSFNNSKAQTNKRRRVQEISKQQLEKLFLNFFSLTV